MQNKRLVEKQILAIICSTAKSSYKKELANDYAQKTRRPKLNLPQKNLQTFKKRAFDRSRKHVCLREQNLQTSLLMRASEYFPSIIMERRIGLRDKKVLNYLGLTITIGHSGEIGANQGIFQKARKTAAPKRQNSYRITSFFKPKSRYVHMENLGMSRWRNIRR